MKSIRFSQVVEKSGKPEVYLLMSENDPDFHKALEAGKIMSLSGESHGSGTEFGTIGYDKKRHGPLLLFPQSLKSFAEARIIGIKYDLFAEDSGGDEKEASPSRTKEKKKVKEKQSKPASSSNPVIKKPAKQKRTEPKRAQRVIPFPAKKEEHDEDDDNDLQAFVRQAMRSLEKGNAVAAYNILKRVIPDP
jgi:hypothetical protein